MKPGTARAAGLLVALFLGGLLHASFAAAAVPPADGQWRAEGPPGGWPEVVYFTVSARGTQITRTNGSIGSPINCGWAGDWATPETVPISGVSFTAHDTGAAAVDPFQLTVTGTFTSRSTATLTFTMICKFSTGVVTTTRTFTASTNAPPPAQCATATVTDGLLQVGGSAAAQARAPGLTRRRAVAIKHSRLDCAEVERVMDSVLQARDEAQALKAAGYRVVRTVRVRPGGRLGYRVSAVRAPAPGVGGSVGGRLSYERRGTPPVDHAIYRPGQWIDIPVDNGYQKCTAAWVLVPRSGRPPMGLTAGHCGPVLAPVTRETRGEGTVIGAVSGRDLNGLDAEVFSLDAIPAGFAQEVERGGRMPLSVVGWVPTGDQHNGERVCFAGRTTGDDQCGKIVKRYTLVPKSQKCTNIHAAHGDSGGPVYTESSGGTTRAVGIVSTIVEKVPFTSRKMCYEPIEPILQAYQADFG